MILFGRFAGHIRKGFIDAAGFTCVHQARVLLGKAVCNFMGNDINPDNGMNIGGSIAEDGGVTAPKRIFELIPVMNAQNQLKRQWGAPEPIDKHIVSEASEIMGIVQRAVGAIDFFVRVFMARK